ncbi:MAG: hypothetical protein D3910_24100, partial [Candidatus Electrothrix sp. ATG2]|nr:hypothetical protein [Candidatus Electrothrix sp. ATG2]
MFDKQQLQQLQFGTGDNIARDKIIHNHLYGSVDYQILVAEIEEVKEDLEDLPPENTERRLRKSQKLNALQGQLEQFKEEVFRLYKIFTRISVNTERLQLAKKHFDNGEFRKADAILDTEKISDE